MTTPAMRRYRVTFDRVGRSSQGVPAPVDLDATSPLHLAELIYPIVRPRLASPRVEVVVDFNTMRGDIFCGMNSGGTFTVEDIS